MNMQVQRESTGLSVERVFLVFETLAAQGRPMTLTEIAQQLGLPKSSMLKLLRGMAQMGYLAEDPAAKTYFPTPKICQLGNQIENILIGHNDIVAMLEDLRDETGESVSVAIQHGVLVEFHHCMSGRHQLTFSMTDGLRYPIYVAAAGRAIMASMQDAEVTKLVKQIKKAKQKDWVDFSDEVLLSDLQDVRDRGYAKTSPDLEASVMSFAMMLPVGEGRRPIAVSLGGLRTRMEGNETKLAKTMENVVQRYFT